MSWKISVFVEPGILVALKVLQPEASVETEALALIKDGLDNGSPLLALAENSEDPNAACLYPKIEANDQTFDELKATVEDLLGQGQVFATVNLMRAAMSGGHASDLDVSMLAASVYELVKFYPLVLPILEHNLTRVEGLQLAAVQLRLARARLRLGIKKEADDLLAAALSCQELPDIMRIEGLLLRATIEPKEKALETLDTLLDDGEECLGDHRIVAEALELHADLLSLSDEAKAHQFYLAAGKMLLRLQDPYFFNLNERLVVHHLRHGQMQHAVGLCQEMFQILKDTQGPPVAALPFLVCTAWVHDQMGDPTKAAQVRDAAAAISPDEVARIQANLELALAEPAAT